MRMDALKNKKEKLGIERKHISIKTANFLSRSICKISYQNISQEIHGTGFFMIYNSLKCLVSINYALIFNLINKNIEIEIYNNKKTNLNLDSRYINFVEPPIDISVVEIKDLDAINEDIEYLKIDLDYKEGGYSQYKEKDVLSLVNPFEEKCLLESGKIKNIIN